MSSPTAELPDLGPLRPGGEGDVERRQRLLQRWRRHSALIAVLRKLLPTLCIAILAAITGWATLNVLFSREGPALRSNSNIRMTNFYLQGRTERGQPYLVTAASVVRDNANSAKMTLDKPVLTLDVGGPTWTTIKANNGVYREDTGMLDLHGVVTLDDYKGNHLVTEHALVDTKKDNADGETHISGHGPLGAIEASSYSLRDGGAYLLFQGGVKLRIEQHPRTTQPAAPAAAAGK